MNFIGETTYKAILIVFLLFFAYSPLSAQVNEPASGKAMKNSSEWVRMTREEYIMRWRHLAIDNMEVYGIPASITMGQAILESGFGNGYLARVANNHFCIKCKSTWTGGKVYHDDDAEGECFRAYPTVADSFQDHAEFLNNGQRYDFLFSYDVTDYKSWAKGLKTAGYATAKDYAERLIRVIEESQLYLLDQPDGIKLYDEYMAKRFGIDPESIARKYAPEIKDKSLAKVNDVVEIREVSDKRLAHADNGVDPNNFRVTMGSYNGYNVHLTNGAHYIVANAGDTFEYIGAKFDISAATLRKFNDLSSGEQPKGGMVIYIERKASRWEGDELLHTVVEGETLHDIAQLYGIRLVQLSKMNRTRATTNLKAGQTIRIK